MAKGDDIQERLINFSVDIIKLCEKLPENHLGKHLSGQLLRCGTSPAPNYGEARGGESREDFINKLGVVIKELNETLIWLETIRRSKIISDEILNPIIGECTQLLKIINSSISTANRK
jgi:four helix bundle protein